MFSTKQSVLVMIIFVSSAIAQDPIFQQLQSMEVLITEVAKSCEIPEPSFEANAKVSNRALYLSESGDHEQAIECYLSLINAGEPEFYFYQDLSISYSKLGKCDKAQEVENQYVAWAEEFMWTGSREWEDPQLDEIQEELAKCRANEEGN